MQKAIRSDAIQHAANVSTLTKAGASFRELLDSAIRVMALIAISCCLPARPEFRSRCDELCLEDDLARRSVCVGGDHTSPSDS
jgi:hypothetical protein